MAVPDRTNPRLLNDQERTTKLREKIYSRKKGLMIKRSLCRLARNNFLELAGSQVLPVAIGDIIHFRFETVGMIALVAAIA